MLKKITYTILFVVILVGGLFLLNKQRNGGYNMSANLDGAGVSEVYKELKNNCLPSKSSNENIGKYKNNILGFEFQYGNELVVCEHSAFPNQENGLELIIWSKKDFESKDSANGPRAMIYVNNALTLNSELLKIYEQGGFSESGSSIGSNKILKKDIQESTCKNKGCEFTVYKFESTGNKFFIKAYAKIDEIIGSFK